MLLTLCILQGTPSNAQVDTISNDQDTFFLSFKRGLIGKLGKSISINNFPADTFIKNDQPYSLFKGSIIKNIYVEQLSLGVALNDTIWNIKNFTTKFADKLHTKTKEKTIRNNLFFKEGDEVYPFLIADNERHLREQVFLQDARIEIVLNEDCSTVDVYVITKDVLSLGGDFELSDTKSGRLKLQDDNLNGNGNKVSTQIFYDDTRDQKVGFGADFTLRNIKGSLNDINFGVLSFRPALNGGKKEEMFIFASFSKPLVSPYMPFTYSFIIQQHTTRNQYHTDSSYQTQNRYQYWNLDTWAAYNVGLSKNINRNDPRNRSRNYVAARVFMQNFQRVPLDFESTYSLQFADISGILSSYTIARQDFYKSRFVYGFGRNEDIPEGYNISIITGYTDKAQRVRGYLAFEAERSQFTKTGHFYNVGLKFSTFLYKNRIEDIICLVNVDYFTKLSKVAKNWSQRTFINASFARISKTVLAEPLNLSSSFGLQELANPNFQADLRATVRAEMVFFNNWSLYGFKFAPLILTGFTALTPRFQPLDKTLGYSSFGAGVRSRNENLVFGTMQLKGYFFPRMSVENVRFKIEFVSNLRFRYSSQLTKRPDFIILN